MSRPSSKRIHANYELSIDKPRHSRAVFALWADTCTSSYPENLSPKDIVGNDFTS